MRYAAQSECESSRHTESETRGPSFHIKSFLVLLALYAFISAIAWAQDIQVTATVDSDSIGVQDQLQLSITVSGKDAAEAEDPRFVSLKNFKIVSGPARGSQFQWINGRTSSSKSFTYLLLPEKEGQYTIEPVEVRVAGKVYKTQPIQIRVTSASSTRSSNPQRRPTSPLDPFDPLEENLRDGTIPSESVLVRAEVDRESAYPGQQVTLAYRVYTQVGISGFELRESPPLSGFWVEDLEIDRTPKGTRRMVNGREYMVFTVKKQALFATSAGRLRLPSSVFAISAETRGGMFGVFRQAETIYRKTQELALEIKPLPTAGRPADFNNAVGTFTLSSTVDKARAATGEAVALRIKLEGQGNLKMIPDVPVPSMPDFTVYSSKRADSIRASSGDQIGGNKTWEYVIVPKTAGRQVIPAVSFSFFDADQAKYKTATAAPLNLEIVPGNETNGSYGLPGNGKQDLVRRGSDINFIKMAPGNLEAKDASPYKYLFLIALAILPFINIGIVVFRRQLLQRADEGLGRKAKRRALEKLKSAEKQVRAQPREFYDQAAAALAEYLSGRFGFTKIELTGDNLERALTQKAIPPGIIEEIRNCLQECDFGRFVSASNSAEKMVQLSERIRRTIEALEGGATRSWSGDHP